MGVAKDSTRSVQQGDLWCLLSAFSESDLDLVLVRDQCVVLHALRFPPANTLNKSFTF